jgi:hypothetical protein
MPGQGPAARWLASAMIVALAGVVWLEVVRERAYPRDVAGVSVLYVPTGRTMRHLSLSYDALLADVYWIRALQHYGGTRLSAAREKHFDLLYPLLDITTTLDPRFSIAYRFGAVFLSELPPGGPGRPDQAIALLQKGLEATPAQWRYAQDIGFVHYWYQHDYRAAAEWFRRAGDIPGAPWWLRSLAAVTLAQGGDRRSSRALWQALLQGAREDGNDWLVGDATRRLQQLDTLDAIDAVRAVVARYQASGGRTPMSWPDLVRAGYLRGVPVDASGVPFELGPWSGDVSVADESPLQPMPRSGQPR